ncbi:hypothetical protein [Phocaeicola sp.]|nr:hypothetical protein [Phocaeicola sp.]
MLYTIEKYGKTSGQTGEPRLAGGRGNAGLKRQGGRRNGSEP